MRNIACWEIVKNHYPKEIGRMIEFETLDEASEEGHTYFSPTLAYVSGIVPHVGRHNFGFGITQSLRLKVGCHCLTHQAVNCLQDRAVDIRR